MSAYVAFLSRFVTFCHVLSRFVTFCHLEGICSSRFEQYATTRFLLNDKNATKVLY
jgi:hypothetical protein